MLRKNKALVDIKCTFTANSDQDVKLTAEAKLYTLNY